MPRKYDKEAAKAKSAERLNEAKQMLTDAVAGWKEDPNNVIELLQFRSTFYQYSFRNTALIHAQNPFVTFVAPFTGWKERGYSVNRGEHGIMILCPVPYKYVLKDGKLVRESDLTDEDRRRVQAGELEMKSGTGFRIGTVFDISQTNCPPEDYPKIYSRGFGENSVTHARLYDIVKGYAESQGIAIIETDTPEDVPSISLRGDATFNRIEINARLRDTQRLSTLTHELGHVLLHFDPALDRPKSRAIREIEADAMDIMLSNAFGIELTDARRSHFFDHIDAATQEDPNFDLTAILPRVVDTYDKVFAAIKQEIENEKDPAAEVEQTSEPVQDVPVDEPPAVEPKQEPVQEPEADVVSAPAQPAYRDTDSLCERIRQEIPILLVAERCGYTVVKNGSKTYNLKEADSCVLYPDTNSFYRFSTGVGGSSIDFMMHMGGVTREEAIRTLAADLDNPVSRSQRPASKPPVQKAEPGSAEAMVLPPPCDGKYSRAYAYLTQTRQIDPEIVNATMSNRTAGKSYLYQDERNNVCFVGVKEDGTPGYACRRSTLTTSQYRGDVRGSDSSVGWFVNNKAAKLYVTESAIDALSVMTLRKMTGKSVDSASYLSLGGVAKLQALENCLAAHPEITEVVAACDRDEAGIAANKAIAALCADKYPTVRLTAFDKYSGKDPNEALCRIRSGSVPLDSVGFEPDAKLTGAMAPHNSPVAKANGRGKEVTFPSTTEKEVGVDP